MLASGAASGSHGIVALAPSVAITLPSMGRFVNDGANSAMDMSQSVRKADRLNANLVKESQYKCGGIGTERLNSHRETLKLILKAR